jgi:hypothetical protein
MSNRAQRGEEQDGVKLPGGELLVLEKPHGQEDDDGRAHQEDQLEEAGELVHRVQPAEDDHPAGLLELADHQAQGDEEAADGEGPQPLPALPGQEEIQEEHHQAGDSDDRLRARQGQIGEIEPLGHRGAPLGEPRAESCEPRGGPLWVLTADG